MAPADYPPPGHLLRRLGIAFDFAGDGATAWVGAAPGLADAAGGVRAGVLATVVDVVGGGLALRVTGGRSATADLALTLARPAAGAAVEARARVLRSGSTTLVVAVDVLTAPAVGRRARTAPLGAATMTFTLLAPRPGDEPPPAVSPGRATPARFGPERLDGPVAAAAGIETGPAGEARMPMAPVILNSFGRAQGGALALLAEEAALTAAEPGRVCLGLRLAYLAPGLAGPLVATATGAGDRARTVAAVTTVDAGRDGRVVTVGHAELVAAGAGR